MDLQEASPAAALPAVASNLEKIWHLAREDFKSNDVWVRSVPKKLPGFFKEAFNDNDLWVGSSAVGSGATVIGATWWGGINLLPTLPLIIAAPGVALCGALIGWGLYGFCAGYPSALKRVKGLWSGTIHAEKKLAKSAEKSLVKRIAEKPLLQKFLGSRAGKTGQWLAKKTYGPVKTGLTTAKTLLMASARAAKTFTLKLAKHPLTQKIFNSRVGKAGQWLIKKLYGVAVAGLTTLIAAGLTTLTLTKKLSTPAVVAAKTFARKLPEHPLAKKIAEKPLMQKFLNSPAGKLRHGPPEKYHNLLLATLTIQGAAIAVAVSAIVIVSQVAALPALTLGGIVGLGASVLVPLWWGGGASLDVYRSASVLKRTLSNWKKEKKNGEPLAEEQVPAATQTTPAAQEPSTVSQLASGTLTPEFTEAVSPAEEKTPKAPAPRPTLAIKPPRP